MDVSRQMGLFMEPESIAVIGASKQTGEGSLSVLENLLRNKFKGKLYPVNPEADSILGINVFPSVRAVPGDIDLALITTPRHAVFESVKDCTRKGVKAIIIVAQGFADGHEDGKKLQADILETAKKSGARVLGPNTIGVYNAFHNLSTSFLGVKLEKIPIGIISQSGLFFPGHCELVLAGKALDIGNGGDVTFADGLEYFENDPETKVILLHIEGMRDGGRFVEVAKRVAKKKPIIAMKTGTSMEGAKAIQSHTGSLVGDNKIYDAIFRQCGVIRAGNMEELYDLARIFLFSSPMKGKRIAVLSMSGAGGVIATDACVKSNLEIARLSPETLAEIRKYFPPWVPIYNPVDLWTGFQISGYPYEELIQKILNAVAGDQNVDGILFISGVLTDNSFWNPRAAILQTINTHHKPVACWMYGPERNDVLSDFEEGKIPAFPSCERAVNALSKLNFTWGN
jgi:acetyltransferase